MGVSSIEIRKADDGELDSKGVRGWPIWTKEPSEFDWHYDGCFERENGERSFLTFMVYLNEGFAGGDAPRIQRYLTRTGEHKRWPSKFMSRSECHSYVGGKWTNGIV